MMTRGPRPRVVRRVLHSLGSRELSCSSSSAQAPSCCCAWFDKPGDSGYRSVPLCRSAPTSRITSAVRALTGFGLVWRRPTAARSSPIAVVRAASGSRSASAVNEAVRVPPDPASASASRISGDAATRTKDPHTSLFGVRDPIGAGARARIPANRCDRDPQGRERRPPQPHQAPGPRGLSPHA